jgi:hypothetical protein
METDKAYRQIYLVLVPHRDIRLIYKNYSLSLFKQGFYGAFHIPWIAPLAAISRPFNTNELNNCARILKNSSKNGKICASKASAVPFPVNENNFSIYGPELDIKIPQGVLGEAEKKVTCFFSPPVIGALLFESGSGTEALPPPPQVSFRAAAAANMYLFPLLTNGAAGFSWKIGKLHWLPKVQNCSNSVDFL